MDRRKRSRTDGDDGDDEERESREEDGALSFMDKQPRSTSEKARAKELRPKPWVRTEKTRFPSPTEYSFPVQVSGKRLQPTKQPQIEIGARRRARRNAKNSTNGRTRATALLHAPPGALDLRGLLTFAWTRRGPILQAAQLFGLRATHSMTRRPLRQALGLVSPPPSRLRLRDVWRL
jgi:hypothetical protein